ncbi:hybrid sensor histidine kinase/response regulator [Glacieibacterium frigidum]|uniref:histidine kinase n=1 Tax=Glacieibacterium frigidum TaxID=2593303 RepID=A0A552UHX5_9SPHN|nr:response regulator [Glacieibacterium frigidum]TRW17824.1 response regulator [Glacieibacterium frigidum]
MTFAAPYAVRPLGPQLDTLLDALPLGLALLDSEGRLINCNEAFVLSVGCDLQRGSPLPPTMVIPADRAGLRTAIADALQGATLPVELRVRIAARPAEPLVVTMTAPPPGVRATLLVAVRDVREQLRLEQQVAQATKMQAIGQLAGGVAHDFNNILTANQGLVEQLLARRAPGDADYDDLEQVRINNRRGADLVHQLLAFARQQTLRLQRVDVRDVIEHLVPLLRRLIGEDIELTLSLAPDAGPIRVDPGQLEQVIVNLAVNARDAMPGGGTLEIVTHAVPADAVAALGHRVMPPADYVAILVCDSGTGIPRELAAKIFEPFFTTKDVGKGTGLGLSTVYGIVKQSGGFVFNAPGPAAGTIFSLYFPRAEDDGASTEPPPPPPPAAADPRGARVLLVEDDRAVRLVLRRALERGGVVVTEAIDALAALPLIEDASIAIDVLVTDVMMPGMDGPELIARARALRPGLPVVLMSGYAEPPQRAAVADHATMFLAKPFGAAALLTAVTTAVRR